LNEFNITNRVDFEHILKGDSELNRYEIKAGYWAEYKARDFNARTIGYIQRGTPDPDVLALPIDQIFAPENIDYNNGFSISENTKYTDEYKASNLLAAGYVSATLPFSDKVRLVPGIRVEYNRQQLETAVSPNGTPDKVDNPVTSVLPFANLAYNLTENSLVRIAYSRTVNRPEFRELAPFSFYDFNFQVDVLGNTGLKVATINNIDLRYEYYPTAGESISIGVFYKNFKNPIETIIRTGANNPVLQFENAVAANNGGVELEIRKSLAYSSPSRFLNGLSVLFNGAYIISEIDLGNNPTLTEKSTRPMQGQSPYIINTGLYYQDEESGLQVNASYNVFGKRIFSVGDQEFPTIWEMPRHLLDLTISKSISERAELKFGVSDLLNSKIKFKEDGNLNADLTEAVDKPILETRNGQYFNFGISFKF